MPCQPAQRRCSARRVCGVALFGLAPIVRTAIPRAFAVRGLDERIPPVIDLPITYINQLHHQGASANFASVPLSRVPSGERGERLYRGMEGAAAAAAVAAAAAPDAAEAVHEAVLMNPRRRPR